MVTREAADPVATGSLQTGLPLRLLLWWRYALGSLWMGLSRHLCLWWQHLIVRKIAALRRTVHAIARSLRAAASRARELAARGIPRDLRHPALPRFALAAACAGVVGGVALASPGLDRRAAALAGLASLMWMVARWFILRFAAAGIFAEDPTALSGAYSLGLLSYAFALTPELRLAAWAASAALTGIALARIGGDRDDLARAIAIAWAAQALVVACGWIARNAFVAFFALPR